MATVLIGADVCPIGQNLPHFEQGDAETLFHDLLPLLQAADLVVANLECPLIERASPIRKTGPVFGAPGVCIEALRRAGIGLLNLANNHIMDHGEAGLRSTMEVCRRAGIATVGAGNDLAEAGRPFVREVKGLRLAVVAVAEREFSIAGATAAGANPLDLISLVRLVREKEAEWDHWIVLYHGAAEFQPVTPRVQRLVPVPGRTGCDGGDRTTSRMCWAAGNATGTGFIVYGQGALVMDEEIYRSREGFHEGFLVRLCLGPRKAAALECIPFRQSKPPPGARLLPAGEAALWRERMEAFSRRLSDPRCGGGGVAGSFCVKSTGTEH
ncbi:MAG: hypothetical protein KatS3mg132_003 [Limisphaera sp.]|nr:MAG: hypothetical protein KatS3mg132_003 [Limisphaera sp.]